MRRDNVGSYLYWSERRVAEIASDNGIDLAAQLSWTLKAAPQGVGAEVGNRERTDLTRLGKARKIESAISGQAVSTFETPPPARFARGVGQVHLARFIGGPERDKGALFHIPTTSSRGQRVDLVLFGSMDNIPGRIFQPSDGPEDGWYSSAWYAIAELLESRGSENTSLWNDPESLSLEALKIAVRQGSTGSEAHHEGEPWTRGYTLGHADACEWFAQIYTDVVLTESRWHLRGSVGGAQRILVGAPVWLRTASAEAVTRYEELRRRADRPWRLRLPFLRRQRH
ncbi:hypothetical protein ACIBMX_03080 [Streptomyces phaeochromogenes]|uniref:hypothetical protein n=1 Tax=Streptomyces phaeochromogenes TaxID=1923 RepID=UPI003402BC4C